MQRIDSWFQGEDGRPHLKGRKRETGERIPRRGMHGSDLDSWIRQYHQGVLALDEAVGRLVQTLKDTGQYENTLIVFTSDQGYAWGQHGFRTKVAPYDANIRSPLIISMPKQLPSAQVCETPVSGPDLIPTFFKFADIKMPWKMHGRDLTPLLKQPNAEHDRTALMVHTGRYYGSDTDQIPQDHATLHQVAGVPWYASLHDGRYKYIRYLVAGEIEELYDLHTDPEELTNLALNQRHSQRLRQMRAETLAELKRTDAGFASALPPVKTVP